MTVRVCVAVWMGVQLLILAHAWCWYRFVSWERTHAAVALHQVANPQTPPSFFLLRLAPVVVQEEEFEEADAHAETEESLGIQGLFDTSSAAGVRSLASKSGMRGATGKASGLIIAGDGVISKRRSGEVDSDDDDEPAGGAGEGGTGEARGARLVVSLLLPCVLAICSCFGFLVSETAVTEVAAASNAIFE